MTIFMAPSLKKSTWLICMASILLLCIWQWVRDAQQLPHLLDSNTLEKTTNIIIYDLQYRRYDEHGTMIHFLETPEMHHIPKDDKHILAKPHMIITEPNKAPWEIHADKGTATSKAQTITLEHHVQIIQHKPSEETEIKTEHLTYYPQEKKAVSNDEVTITQAGSQIRSKGMIADLTDNHIQLLSNARGHYVKPKG